MLVDGYVRVSQVKGREGERFMSPRVQRDHIERWAARNDAELVHVFEELDESGRRSDRPLLQRAIARVERGDSDGVAVAYLSRFGRSLSDALCHIERIMTAGGKFISVQEGGVDFTTDTGRLILRVLFSVAEWELDRTRTVWATANQRAVARGVFPARRPFGYQRDADGRLVVAEEEAQWLKEVFRRRADGVALWELCRLLELNKVKTANGNSVWHTTSLRGIVKSRTYRGEIHRGDMHNLDAHAALVDETTWRAAQGQSMQFPPRRGTEQPLLRGLLRCGGCQRLMGAQIINRGSSLEARIYLCRKALAVGDCPAPTMVSDRLVEPYIEALLLQEAARQRGTATAKRLARLERELERRREELIAYRDNERLPHTLGPERFAGGLRIRVERVERAQTDLSRASLHAQRRLPSVSKLRERWPSMSVGERRQAIATVIECVFVTKGKGRVEARTFVCAAGRAPRDLPPASPYVTTTPRPFDPTTCPPPLRRRQQREWDEDRLVAELDSFLIGRTHWPSYTEFQTAGLGLLHRQMERGGGFRYWAESYDLPLKLPRTRNRVQWSEQRFRDELAAYLPGHVTWPTEKQFQAAGKAYLYRHIRNFGGAERWAAEFGLDLRDTQRSKQAWPYGRLRSELSRLTRGTGVWPTEREFVDAGHRDLHQAIKRRNLRDRLVRDLALADPRRHGDLTRRWTEEARTQALGRFLKGRTSWPTNREFHEAGLSGLLRAIDRTSSRETYAHAYRLTPPRRLAHQAPNNVGGPKPSSASPSDTPKPGEIASPA